MFKLAKEGKTYKVEVAGAVFIGAPLKASRVNALSEKHTETKITKGKPARDFKAAAFSKDLFIETVTGWEEIVDDSGAPLPCDEANKGRLYEEHPKVAAEVLEAFDEAARAEAEGDRKN